MSIIRLSCLKGAIHGLNDLGETKQAKYDRRSTIGETEVYREPELDLDSLDSVLPGADGMDWRNLDARGFPRENSDLSHLISGKLDPAIENLDGPIVVLVHGFLFNPRESHSAVPEKSDNPHARIYHFQRSDDQESIDNEIRHHTSSWPRGLGFTDADKSGTEGLAIAFGWNSAPGFASSLIQRFQNYYARAYNNGGDAAWNMLTMLHVLDQKLPEGRKIDFFCHSLGSRVVVRAIALAVKHKRFDVLHRLDRVIVLGGSEYVVEAQLMLNRLRNVGTLDDISFYNVVSRENDVLDLLGENFGRRTFGNSNVIGHNGLDVEDSGSLGPYWLDIQIDGSRLQKWLALYSAEHPDGPIEVSGDRPGNVWDHWYYFTHRGNMRLYNEILRNRDVWTIDRLRSTELTIDPGIGPETIPDRVSRRRSIFGD